MPSQNPHHPLTYTLVNSEAFQQAQNLVYYRPAPTRAPWILNRPYDHTAKPFPPKPEVGWFVDRGHAWTGRIEKKRVPTAKEKELLGRKAEQALKREAAIKKKKEREEAALAALEAKRESWVPKSWYDPPPKKVLPICQRTFIQRVAAGDPRKFMPK